MTGDIAKALSGLMHKAHVIRMDIGTLQSLFVQILSAVGLALLAPLGFVLLAAFTAAFIQNGVVISAEQMKPKFEKLSLAKGVKRLFSVRALGEFVKGLLKLAIVATVVALLLWPERSVIATLVTVEMTEFLTLVQSLAFRVLISVLAVMTVIASLDFLFQKYQHLKQLRMSKQDLKDEFKQTEGDPIIKARLRQIRTERARQRMMAAVPDADVVVTNPTHFAVALQYEVGSTGAPRVVAKGVDSLALRIRDVAEENDVPVVENPPLARTLYDGVDLDQEIPLEQYKAVAEIIGYVMRLKGKRIPARGR
jgi:flagellar biosynthetic protein FlhB